MKILKYSLLAIVVLCAILSITTTDVKGFDGWIWQLTTILWVANYAVLSYTSDLSDKLIKSYGELVQHLLNRIEQLKKDIANSSR
jgi:hypothetical protein